MATVSVRYIVDDVEAAVAFTSSDSASSSRSDPHPALPCFREATYACCSTNPVPAGQASPRPRVAGRNQGAGTASSSRSTTSSTRLPCCVRSAPRNLSTQMGHVLGWFTVLVVGVGRLMVERTKLIVLTSGPFLDGHGEPALVGVNVVHARCAARAPH